MTRIRVGVAALAVGLLLAGCGPDDSAPVDSGAGPAGSAGTTTADGGTATGGDAGQGAPGGRWCEAVRAFTAAVDPLFGPDAAGDKATADRARSRLAELKAAAPAEITSQVAELSEFYAAVIDTAGKSMVGDPAAYARLGETVTKVETAMPPVSDYTVQNCPGLDRQLPVEAP